MTDFAVKPLTKATWSDFADLAERHDGVWGGCWCMGFHAEGALRGDHRRAAKEQRVRDGTAHAALVFDGAICVGWCQFGPTDELPRIKSKREYLKVVNELPDWRITCFFVDKGYHGQGVAAAALAGALDLISKRGGGTVESYPEDADDRKVSASFLHNGTLAMFEEQGFERTHKIAKHRWVVRKVMT